MLAAIIEEAPRFFTGANLRFLLDGLLTTLILAGAGCLIGGAAGALVAVLRGPRAPVPRLIQGGLGLGVEAFRRVPFLVTLLLVFFAAQGAGLDLPVLWIAVASVCLIAGAYISEIVRAGIASVHPNQWDSALTMNLGYAGTLRHVVLPQAWRVILPPAFGFFLMFIKDSALASQIGVVELTYVGKALNNKGFTPALSWGSVLVAYFVLSYPLARLGRALEVRLAPSRRR